MPEYARLTVYSSPFAAGRTVYFAPHKRPFPSGTIVYSNPVSIPLKRGITAYSTVLDKPNQLVFNIGIIVYCPVKAITSAVLSIPQKRPSIEGIRI